MSDKPRDSVERDIVVRASIERAFAALTDPALFPTWGPERVEGTIAPGERPILDFGPSGRVAVYVVAVQPPRYFAYRWLQGVTDPEVMLSDPLKGHSTLVEFSLEEVEGGTRVRVVESGLASLPIPEIPGLDRNKAIDHMGEGWQLMLGGLAKHFEGDSAPRDRVEEKRVLKAPRERVFGALVRPETWWAKQVDGSMAPGERPVLDFGPFGKKRILVVANDPTTCFSFRWAQGTDDPKRSLEDPQKTSNTLVEVRLEDAPEGTRLHLAESGFDSLPADARTRYFKRAQQAWAIVLGMLEMHLAK